MQKDIILVKSLSVASGSNYVTTNIAHTLGLNDKNKQILIIDFNLNNPSLFRAFPNTNHSSIDNIASSINDKTKIEEVIDLNIDRLSSNLSVIKGTKLTSGFSAESYYSYDLTSEMIKEIVKNTDFDTIVISSGSNLNDSSLALIDICTQLLTVVRSNAYGLDNINDVREFSRLHKPEDKPKVVINYYIDRLKNELDIKTEGMEIVSVLNYEEDSVDNIDVINNLENKFSGVMSKIKRNKGKEDFLELIKKLNL